MRKSDDWLTCCSIPNILPQSVRVSLAHNQLQSKEHYLNCSYSDHSLFLTDSWNKAICLAFSLWQRSLHTVLFWYADNPTSHSLSPLSRWENSLPWNAGCAGQTFTQRLKSVNNKSSRLTLTHSQILPKTSTIMYIDHRNMKTVLAFQIINCQHERHPE